MIPHFPHCWPTTRSELTFHNPCLPFFFPQCEEYYVSVEKFVEGLGEPAQTVLDAGAPLLFLFGLGSFGPRPPSEPLTPPPPLLFLFGLPPPLASRLSLSELPVLRALDFDLVVHSPHRRA